MLSARLSLSGKRAKREGMLLYDMFREARILKRADEHICLVVTGPNLAAFLNHPDLQVCIMLLPACVLSSSVPLPNSKGTSKRASSSLGGLVCVSMALQTCFLNMACCCDVVVAARVTPTQKADMVQFLTLPS